MSKHTELDRLIQKATLRRLSASEKKTLARLHNIKLKEISNQYRYEWQNKEIANRSK